jgi:hypothetical protein
MCVLCIILAGRGLGTNQFSPTDITERFMYEMETSAFPTHAIYEGL